MQLEIDEQNATSEEIRTENLEPQLEEEAMEKLDEENPDLDMENADWPERPGSALSSVPGDFECQNPEDPW